MPVLRPLTQTAFPRDQVLGSNKQFSFVFNGSVCGSVRLTIYAKSGISTLIEVDSIVQKFYPKVQNGEVVTVSYSGDLSSYSTSQLFWQVRVYEQYIDYIYEGDGFTVEEEGQIYPTGIGYSVGQGTSIITNKPMNYLYSNGDKFEIDFLSKSGTRIKESDLYISYYPNGILLYYYADGAINQDESLDAPVFDASNVDFSSSGMNNFLYNVQDSEMIPFRCYTGGEIGINPINTSSNYYVCTEPVCSFSAYYLNPNNIPINSFVFYIYNENQDLIYQSEENFGLSIVYTYNGLLDGQTYYIRFTAKDIYGMGYDTGLQQITVSFTVNKLLPVNYKIITQQDCENMSVDVLIPSPQYTAIVTQGGSISSFGVLEDQKESPSETDSVSSFVALFPNSSLMYNTGDTGYSKSNDITKNADSDVPWFMWAPFNINWQGDIVTFNFKNSTHSVTISYDGHYLCRTIDSVTTRDQRLTLQRDTTYVIICNHNRAFAFPYSYRPFYKNSVEVLNKTTEGQLMTPEVDSSDTTSLIKATSESLNSFDNLWITRFCRPCVFKNGVVNYYLNRDNYNLKEDGTASVLTGEDGDVMIEIPRFYFCNRIISATGLFTSYAKIYNAQNEVSSSLYSPQAHLIGNNVCDYVYVGAYLGTIIDGKLRSVSGVTPTTNTSLEDFRDAAMNNGVGYQIMDWGTLDALQCIAMCVVGVPYLQNVCGLGVSNAQGISQTGGSNTSSFISGAQDGLTHCKWLGIEDFYGNLWQFVDGVKINDQMQCLVATQAYNNGATTYVTERGNTTFSALSGYVTKGYESYTLFNNTTNGIALGSPFIPIGVQSTGGSYYKAYGSVASNSFLRYGGSFDDGDKVSPYSMCYDSDGSGQPNLGARLVYKG